MRYILSLLFIINFLNANHYEMIKDEFFKYVKCTPFEHDGEFKFSVNDLTNAIKIGDVKKVKAVLSSDKSLAFGLDSSGKTPYETSLDANNSLSVEIENLLLCADERVFKFEEYPIYLVMDQNLSDNQTASLLKELLDEGLDVNKKFLTIKTTLFMSAFYEKKFQTLDLVLKNGAKIPADFGNAIWFWFVEFFIEKKLLFTIKEPVPNEILVLIQTKEYENHKNEIFKFISYIKNYGFDPKNLDTLYKTLNHLDDKDGLKSLLNLGYNFK
ncbi:hypothetical protein F1B92_01555 [Campylobacter sp. FMV-PI01]|uniref:Ankyrin repeat domain-containing protein n=1 Tax=Campylobacter portucalensis TaxID=2608384 RepID=A0A6L5WHJ0_9BACT|nr:hypothetical protein [Campylobacter portucalensis]MSN95892.1 hypothetical protein [Campylobacter portucalensis]